MGWYSSYFVSSERLRQRDSSPRVPDKTNRRDRTRGPSPTPPRTSTTATARAREDGTVAGVKSEEKNRERSARKRSERRLEGRGETPRG